jgi:hypothetical protein
VVRDGAGFVLTLDPAFQGLPDTAHGGSVLAAFHLVASGVDRGTMRGVYRRRVPLGVPLKLTTLRDDRDCACELRDLSGTTLVDGVVSSVADTDEVPPPLPPANGHPLPVSSACFACGIDNAFGLRVQLRFDDDGVGGSWTPRQELTGADGTLAPLALTTLLDEAAFWLGALASGESGMTTELAVTLHAAVTRDRPLIVAGAREAVRQRANDPRYWDTTVVIRDAAGRCAASAHITFVAVRGAARRLVNGMLRMNASDIVRRVFPAYV